MARWTSPRNANVYRRLQFCGLNKKRHITKQYSASAAIQTLLVRYIAPNPLEIAILPRHKRKVAVLRRVTVCGVELTV